VHTESEKSSSLREDVFFKMYTIKNIPPFGGMFFIVYMVRVLSYRAHFSMGAKINCARVL